MEKITVVEDEDKLRLNLILDLEDAGYKANGLSSGEEALQKLSEPNAERPNLLLLDVRMGAMSGVDLVRELSKRKLLPPTIIISGEATISETVEALNLGVHDFIEKPFSRERLFRSIGNCLEHHSLLKQVEALQKGRETPILGNATCITALKQQIARIAPTEGRILIHGESGAGKELVANAIHNQSRRSKGPFIKLNCASLPAGLIEDELFGHVRGAFTDARTDKPGLFEEAHGGTIFLDEIGDMDITLQTRLLRVLEDGRVRRLGGSRDIEVDVRVISATNRNLPELIEKKQFREDLFFRLNTIPITSPPLRERAGDIQLLVAYYLDRFCRQNRFRLKKIDPKAMNLLSGYRWPGNVRELRNLCERLVILGGDPITISDLPSELLGGVSTGETAMVRLPTPQMNMTLKQFKNRCEKEYIESMLKRKNWNYVDAARELDIQRTYLHRKIQTLGIRKPMG